MSIRFAGLVALGLAATPAVAQLPSASIVTRALEPSERDLDRLGLTAIWRIYLPVENRGDGIALVQPMGDQVFVQLKSGILLMIQAVSDPKTFRKPGDVVWTYRTEFRGTALPVAANADEVYLVQGQRLTLLDRADGKVKYTEQLQSTASAGPLIDSTSIYIPLSNRQIVSFSHVSKIPGYTAPKMPIAPDPFHRQSLAIDIAEPLSTPSNRSPSIARLETLRSPFKRSGDMIDSSISISTLRTFYPPYRAFTGSRSPTLTAVHDLKNIYELSSKDGPTRIRKLWEMQIGATISSQPLIIEDADDPRSNRLVFDAGRTVFTSRLEAHDINTVLSQFRADSMISAPLTHHGEWLYVATDDSNFRAFSLKEIRDPNLANTAIPRSSFTTGGTILEKPILLDDSLYVVGARWGLIRLKRLTLDPMWQERLEDGRIRSRPTAGVVKVLAINSNHVYALNDRGNLLIIDAHRGDILSTFDASGFNVPVTNERDDRLYLAANSGLLIALRDKDIVTPLPLRKARKGGPGAAIGPKNEAGEPKEEPKADPKVEPEMKKDPEPKAKVDPEPKEKVDPDPKEKVDPEPKKEKE
jgi:hypothetical protein